MPVLEMIKLSTEKLGKLPSVTQLGIETRVVWPRIRELNRRTVLPLHAGFLADGNDFLVLGKSCDQRKNVSGKL